MERSRWSRAVAIAAVLILADIAAVLSYSHMYGLALRHGEPEWRGALGQVSEHFRRHDVEMETTGLNAPSAHPHKELSGALAGGH